MNRAFVEMYAYAVLILLLLGILSSLLAEWWMTLYRRWQVRREMKALRSATTGYLGPLIDMAKRRQQLESAATAQDKHFRKGVH